ncbi:MAG: hypothetical protein H7144_09680 [Burkholderiales bacterium]|nr:hypothetical protein [Phycisphaerae bacterium]
MLALFSRKAELILLWIKTVELRSRLTQVIGERFCLNSVKSRTTRPISLDDLMVAVGHPTDFDAHNHVAWISETSISVQKQEKVQLVSCRLDFDNHFGHRKLRWPYCLVSEPISIKGDVASFTTQSWVPPFMPHDGER